MRSITLGLALSLVGGIAMAQVAPAPAANPPGPNGTAQPMPPAPPSPPGGPAQQPAQQPAPQGDARGAPNMATATQGGPPEGMIVETPNGFYLVHPGQGAPRRLDFGRGAGAPDATAQNGPASPPPPDDDAMEADDGAQPPPPPPQHRPPPPPEGKGARFRIKTPNLTLGMKCPDDEPIKACIDAVAQLLDKASAGTR